MHVIHDIVLEPIDIRRAVQRAAPLHRMIEVTMRIRELLRHLRDLEDGSGIEMRDAAFPERAQHKGVRIALHRIENRAGKALDKGPRAFAQDIGKDAEDWIGRVETIDDFIDGAEMRRFLQSGPPGTEHMPQLNISGERVQINTWTPGKGPA